MFQMPAFLIRMLGQFVASFHPRALPPMLRASYARELASWFFLPIMLAGIEGSAIAVIAKKAFSAGPNLTDSQIDFAVAILAAAPNVANLTSFAWAAVAHGRSKIKFIGRLQIITALLVGLIAIVPETADGLTALCVLVVTARCAWTGVLTLRTAVWRNNYPRANRAVIAGRMATIQALMLAATGFVMGWALDLDARAYHLLFPALACFGLIGNAIYRKVRLRGAQRLKHAERKGRAEDSPSLNPVAMWRLLHQDRPYAAFMGWMMVLGIGNLMVVAPQAIILEDQFNATYLEGLLNTTVIPVLIMPLAIPMWSRLLGRMHVVQFRSLHSWAFVLATALMWLGAWLDSFFVFQLSAVAMGVGYAGGALAWNLGHHDFAPANRDSEYMAVHVTLNGIRGFIAPLAAVALYKWLLPHGAGSWVFFVALIVTLVGAVGFQLLWKQLRELPRHGG
ncbi:MAG: MFS transporter [Phycisphaerales bacterium]|nr:MFS transporter [Phycisphaerales bacterium]